MPIVLFVKYLLFLPQYMLVIVKKTGKYFQILSLSHNGFIFQVSKLPAGHFQKVQRKR